MHNIFGHRGLPKIYRENSIEGLNKAFEYCDFVETDVRITLDNYLVLQHDPDINGKLVKDMFLEEVMEAIGVIDEEDIVLHSRDQLLGRVNFEIKTSSLDAAQIDIVFQKMLSILKPGDFVSSFDGKAINSFKNLFPCHYGIILDNEEALFQAKAVSNHDAELFFMIEKSLFDARIFELPLDRTAVWTVNDEKEFERLIEIGVFGVITDIPDTMHIYRK